MGLPEAQRLMVNAWLFEEGFTYEEVVEGCLREFGLKVSKSSVGRYYERKSADRFAKVQREKHQETRVWVERRKAENWLAREVLRQWKRTMKKTAHPSYLPILGTENGRRRAVPARRDRPTIGKGRNQRDVDGKPAIQQVENLRHGAAASNGMNPAEPGFHLANYAQFGSIKP